MTPPTRAPLDDCPFCDGKAERQVTGSYKRRKLTGIIQCENCLSSALNEKAWNTRSTPTAKPGDGFIPTHRHKKRGTDYQVIGMGRLQTNDALYDDCRVVIYQDQCGELWVRSNFEFDDTDRFAVLPQPPNQETEG